MLQIQLLQHSQHGSIFTYLGWTLLGLQEQQRFDEEMEGSFHSDAAFEADSTAAETADLN